MRTETYTRNIYEYDELSDEAKEAVKEWYLEYFHSASDYEFDCEEQINSTQLNRGGDIKVTFDYTYGYGYTRIYGQLNLYNVIDELVHNSWTGESKIDSNTANLISFCFDQDSYGDYMVNVTERESENIFEYIEENIDSCIDAIYERDENNHLFNFDDDEMQKSYSINNLIAALETFKELACDYIESINNDLTAYGNAFFFDIDEGEIEDTCEANGYEFYEDGTLV